MAVDEVPTIEVRAQFFPVSWGAAVTRELFRLLVGSGFYPARAWGNEGGDPLPSDADQLVDTLVASFEGSSRSNRTTLFTDRPSRIDSFELARHEWGGDAALGASLHWPKTLRFSRAVPDLAPDERQAVIVRMAELTAAPIVEIDYRGSAATLPLSLVARREQTRIVRGRVHAKAAAGIWRGLTGVSWRSVVGPDLVRTVGVDRLRALEPDHAVDHGNGWWTLQTTADPAESVTEHGRAAEATIVAALGRRFFFDLERDRLPEVTPDFPAHLVPDDGLLRDRFGERLAPLRPGA